LAILSNSIWLIELYNYGGWRGLEWISNFHYSLYIIPFLFIIWLFFISYSLKVKIYPVLYGIIYIIFFYISMRIFRVLMSEGMAAFFTFMYYAQYLPSFILKNVYIYYIFWILLEIILIYILNIIICLFETRKIILKDIIIISLHIIIIPVLLVVTSYIILSIIKQYDRYCLEPIHWFKTGSIISGYIIYECSYIYYIKNKKRAVHNSAAAASSPGADSVNIKMTNFTS